MHQAVLRGRGIAAFRLGLLVYFLIYHKYVLGIPCLELWMSLNLSLYSVKFSSPYSQRSAPLLATRKVSLSCLRLLFSEVRRYILKDRSCLHFSLAFLLTVKIVNIHTWLTMYNIRPFLYDIINVSLWLSQWYITQCIGYNTNGIGAIAKSDQMRTNTLCEVTLTKL